MIFNLAKKQNYYLCSRFRERKIFVDRNFDTMRGRAEAARRAHNPEVGGSNPPPATDEEGDQKGHPLFFLFGGGYESVVKYSILRQGSRPFWSPSFLWQKQTTIPVTQESEIVVQSKAVTRFPLLANEC